ncbi:hypothetical protein AKJ16_DCAP22065 [Drosera capensis]
MPIETLTLVGWLPGGTVKNLYSKTKVDPAKDVIYVKGKWLPKKFPPKISSVNARWTCPGSCAIIVGLGGKSSLTMLCYPVLSSHQMFHRYSKWYIELNECDLLSKIHHPNVIALLGYCIHGETRFLVYKLMMGRGSLEYQLHACLMGLEKLVHNVKGHLHHIEKEMSKSGEKHVEKEKQGSQILGLKIWKVMMLQIFGFPKAASGRYRVKISALVHFVATKGALSLFFGKCGGTACGEYKESGILKHGFLRLLNHKKTLSLSVLQNRCQAKGFGGGEYFGSDTMLRDFGEVNLLEEGWMKCDDERFSAIPDLVSGYYAGNYMSQVILLLLRTRTSIQHKVYTPTSHLKSTTGAKNGFAPAMGFCLHNNAAIATLAAQATGAKKDAHHGNGTQELFDGSTSALESSSRQLYTLISSQLRSAMTRHMYAFLCQERSLLREMNFLY